MLANGQNIWHNFQYRALDCCKRDTHKYYIALLQHSHSLTVFFRRMPKLDVEKITARALVSLRTRAYYENKSMAAMAIKIDEGSIFSLPSESYTLSRQGNSWVCSAGNWWKALVTNHNRLPGSFAGSQRERKEIVSVQIHHHKFHVAARREEQLVRSGPFISLNIAHVRSRLQSNEMLFCENRGI